MFKRKLAANLYKYIYINIYSNILLEQSLTLCWSLLMLFNWWAFKPLSCSRIEEVEASTIAIAYALHDVVTGSYHALDLILEVHIQ